MKKAFLTGVMICACAMSANAQLGKPTISVKDTLYISEVYYNGTKLNRADWPDTMIVEDALKIYVANFVYVKGKLKKELGGRNYYDATCNGKTSSMIVERDYKYTIDDYVFIVKKDEEKNNVLFNNNAIFKGRRNSTEVESDSPRWSNGNNYLLNGRTAVSLPKPHYNYNYNVQGKIVVKIWVNRDGDVVKAECPVKGSTISDAKLVSIAKKSALKTKFSSDENAPELQIGTITFVFQSN